MHMVPTPVMRSRIRAYILDRIDAYDYDANPKTDEERVLWCYETFKKEKSYELARTREIYAFESWLQGLASALFLPFLYLDSATDLLKKWMDFPVEKDLGMDEYGATLAALRLVVNEFFIMLSIVNLGGKIR